MFDLRVFASWIVLLSGCQLTGKSPTQTQFDDYAQAVQEGDSSELETLCNVRFWAACLWLKRVVPDKQLEPVSVLLGVPFNDAAQLNVVVEKNVPYEFRLLDQKVFHAPAKLERREIKDSDWAVIKLKYSKLELKKKYQLQVFRAGELVDYRFFQLLDGGKQNVRVALASCMDDAYDDIQHEMWKRLLKSDPDYIFLIGDNVYADRRVIGHYKDGTPGPHMWYRYATVRNKLAIFRARELVPIHAIWDDHDFGQNNGGRDNPFLKEAQDIFRVFYAQAEHEPVLTSGPGVSSVLEFANFRAVFVDGRSFRRVDADDGDETQWGPQQEEWLLKLLGLPKPTLLIQGDQFYGGYHRFESYQSNNPNSFKSMMRRLRQVPSPIGFVSGDRHLLELMKIPRAELGYETFELTTSAIHAKTFPSGWVSDPNPLQVEGHANQVNFAVVESSVDSGGWELNIRGFGMKDKLFERDIVVSLKGKK